MNGRPYMNYFPAITALQWTSLNTIPNGFPLVACIGQNVSFPWTFDTTALEHEITAEWDFEPPGKQTFPPHSPTLPTHSHIHPKCIF